MNSTLCWRKCARSSFAMVLVAAVVTAAGASTTAMTGGSVDTTAMTGTGVDATVMTGGSVDTTAMTGTSVDTSSADEIKNVFRCDEETNYYKMIHDREFGVEDWIDRVETTADGGKMWEVLGGAIDPSLTWEEDSDVSPDCVEVTHLPETQRFEWPGKLLPYGIGSHVGGGNHLLHMCGDADGDVFFYRYGQSGEEPQMFAELFIKNTSGEMQNDELLGVVLSNADPLLLFSLLMAGNSSLCDFVENTASSVLDSGSAETRKVNALARQGHASSYTANRVVATVLQEHYLLELNTIGFGELDWSVYDNPDCKDCKKLFRITEKRAGKRPCKKICAKVVNEEEYELFENPKKGCNKLCKALDQGKTKNFYCKKKNDFCS